jgi:hypothetical protein
MAPATATYRCADNRSRSTQPIVPGSAAPTSERWRAKSNNSPSSSTTSSQPHTTTQTAPPSPQSPPPTSTSQASPSTQTDEPLTRPSTSFGATLSHRTELTLTAIAALAFEPALMLTADGARVLDPRPEGRRVDRGEAIELGFDFLVVAPEAFGVDEPGAEQGAHVGAIARMVALELG